MGSKFQYCWKCDICGKSFECTYCKNQKNQKNTDNRQQILECELINMKYVDYDGTVKHICFPCYSGGIGCPLLKNKCECETKSNTKYVNCCPNVQKKNKCTEH